MRIGETAWVGLGLIALLVGCGDATVPSPWSAPVVAADTALESSGPVLRSPSSLRPADPTRAWRDRDGRIHVPAGATWHSLRPALAKSLAVLRERESDDEPRTCCDGDASMLIALPGVEGYAVVGGRVPTWNAGLLVRLTRTQDQTTITIHTQGPDWLTTVKSRALSTRWHSSSAVLKTLNEALAALKIAGPNSHRNFAQFHIDAHVPAAEVIACATAIQNAQVTIRLLSEGRDVWDPVDQSLEWLRVHQLKTGEWHDERGMGYCDGKRLEHVAHPAEVEPGSHVAPTALALLAFLSAGYTHRGIDDYPFALSRGMRALRKRQRDHGDFGGDPRDHLIATLVMLTALRRTGSPLCGRSAQRALAYFPGAWQHTGDDPAATVFAAACVYQANQIAAERVRRKQAPQLELPDGMATAIRGDARRLLQSPTLSRRAAGTAALLLLGGAVETDKPLRTARAALRTQPLDIVADPLTSWFLLMIRAHGARSSQSKQIEVLALPQREDGHACYTLGSFDPTSNGEITAERIAATAFGSLCLQGLQGNAFPWR